MFIVDCCGWCCTVMAICVLIGLLCFLLLYALGGVVNGCLYLADVCGVVGIWCGCLVFGVRLFGINVVWCCVGGVCCG